ncbi:MAG: hypothetical protein IPK25_14375 [Saprospiraceae bacterium]|nr:hypothetical protein [Saprospiraceae bacterium]
MELKYFEAYALIDVMEDFIINIQTNEVVFDENTNTNLILLDNMSTKKYLKLFLQELIDKSNSKSISEFNFLLLKKRQFYQKVQYEIITKFNTKIDNASEHEKHELETDKMKYLGLFRSIYQIIKIVDFEFEKQLNEQERPEKHKIERCSDILAIKFKDKATEILELLGRHFPDYYNEDGKALNNKHILKAILNTFYRLLKVAEIITINPTKKEKDQICQVFIEKCMFSDNKLSPKTLFNNEGIEHKTDFKTACSELKKSINALKSNKLNK